MSLKVLVYSRQEISESKFNDDNIDSYPDDYFIGVNATGYIHKHPYFAKDHQRVMNVYFDDVEEDQLKHDTVFDIFFEAKACTEEQATGLKNFIQKIPDDATLHVYCTKGKSRSPAIAKYVAETRKVSNELSFSNFNKHVYNLLCQI